MQDAPLSPVPVKNASRGTVFVSGTLIVILAAGIGMQVWRSQNGKAADEQQPTAAGRAVVAPTGKPVARVNGQAISYDELASECVQRTGNDVLENVINRTLIQQACAQRGVSVSDAEVNTEITRISRSSGLPV
ncbi:MAG: SurA N-terminal domain-containing protein [Planctomycetaceae bacterium]